MLVYKASRLTSRPSIWRTDLGLFSWFIMTV